MMAELVLGKGPATLYSPVLSLLPQPPPKSHSPALASARAFYPHQPG